MELQNWLAKINPTQVKSTLEQILTYQKAKPILENVSSLSPEKPHPRQLTFLSLDADEALYGGAVGGGKSSCLLLDSLRYVHIPGYSALLLRTDLQRFKLPGGLIPRSHEWLYGKATWNGSLNQWTFPSGATLRFGFLNNMQDRGRYMSTEFQYIGYDELTEFSEENYLFMFSRLRMKETIKAHGVKARVRGASNPGSKGHEWVMKRFITDDAKEDLKNNELKRSYVTKDSVENYGSVRVFVPAKLADNPSINKDDYMKQLIHLPPLTRQRLVNGDWSVMPEGLVKEHWFRYYSFMGEDILTLVTTMDREGNTLHTNDILERFEHINDHSSMNTGAYRFLTIDTAGGMKQIIDDKKGKVTSYTAIGVWDSFFSKSRGKRNLCLRYVWRGKEGFTAIASKILELNTLWKPSKIRIEDKTMGPGLADLLKHKCPISLISSGIVDKVVRSAGFLNMMEQGLVFFPKIENTWKPAYEAELLSWQGLDTDTNDQIDISSYAAMEVGGLSGGIMQLREMPQVVADLPSNQLFTNEEYGTNRSMWF